MEAFLELVSTGRVDPAPLITHRFPIGEADRAYQLIQGADREDALGILLEYDIERPIEPEGSRVTTGETRPAVEVRLGAVGAGKFAIHVLFPKLKAISDLSLVGLASARGLSSADAGERFGFNFATAEFEELLADESINTIAVLTRHHLHAEQVTAALGAGKHVFCEKPLAIGETGLATIRRALRGSSQQLTVGFNRRFAPLFTQLRAFFEEVAGPKVMQYRVNAEPLPADHWLNDPTIGGGRLIGEVCHFVDAAVALCGSLPVQVHAEAVGGGNMGAEDLSLLVRFDDGSLASILYTVEGARAQAKERLEVFGGGRSAVLDDFRRLEAYAEGRRRVGRSWLRQDKGHEAIWSRFVERIRAGGPPIIPYEQLFAVTEATFAAERSLRSGQPQTVSLTDATE